MGAVIYCVLWRIWIDLHDLGSSWLRRHPWGGGSKESGIGREGGVHSLEFYTELQNVCIKI